MRVLLVEDHLDVARSTVMLLELLGHEVHLAETGGAALSLAAEVRPEIMLVDIGLPDMTGFEIAERVRATAGLECTVMVALTGYDCKEKAAASGFNHYCKKPMNLDRLEDFVARASSG